MKLLKWIYWFMAAVPALIVCFCFPFLPDIIPGHYGLSGQVDRWGSKWELTVMPIIAVLMALFLWWMRKIGKKQDAESGGGKNTGERTIVILGIVASGVFAVLTAVFTALSFTADPSVPAVPQNLSKLIPVVFGLMFIVLGLIMPKVKRNGLFGLRTSKSMANDQAWKLSQKYGGISFVITGAVVFAAGMMLSAEAGMIVMVAVLVADIPASILIANYAYKRSLKEME